MPSCPIKTDPEWIALENAIGKEQAYIEYVKNDYTIPKIKGTDASQNYSFGKESFNQISTLDALNKHPEISDKIITKLNELYPQVKVYKDRILVQGKSGMMYKNIDPTKGNEGLHYRNAFMSAVAWSNDSSLEVPPHEYAHDYIEMFQDVPLVKQLIEIYGVEELATKLGKDFVNRILSPKNDNLMTRVWNYIKSVFGTQDVFDLLARNFYKGKKLSENVHQGNAIFNHYDRTEVLKRNVGAVDTDGKYNDTSIPLENVSPQIAKDMLFQVMSGYNVFEELLTEEVADELSSFFMEKPVGEVKFDRAAIVWKDMIKAIRMIDTDNKGRYSNNAGLSSKKLNRLDRNLSKTDYAQELFKLFDSKEIPPISERATNPLVDDYWTIINITQKMSFIQKSKDAIIADGDKFVSKYSIFEDIDKDIQDNQKRKKAFINKIKNKTLRTAVEFVFQKMNDWYITPFMQAKFLAGEGSFLMKFYYGSLVDGDTKKLKILRTFNNFMTLKDGAKERLGKYSTQLYKGLNINEYDGQEFSVYENSSDKESKIKLTNGEILSLYLTAQQRDNTNINNDENTPRNALIESGFTLESIEGRNDLQNTNYKLTKSGLEALENYVKNNKDLLQVVENTRGALDYLYDPVSKTFREQNGFELPSYESYYPVKTMVGSYNIRTAKNDIENFGSIKDRLGTKQALHIADINKTLSYHSQVASSYAALAIPVQNNKKILKMLKEKYEGAGKDYKEINQLVNQMEEKLGQINDPSQLFNTTGEKKWERTVNKITANFGVSVLAWNIPVMMKQPISYLAAKEEIDKSYLKKAGWGVGGVVGISFADIMKAIKYTGVKGGETMLPIEWKLDKSNPVYNLITKYSPALTQRFEGAVDRELGEAMFEKQFGNDEITIPILKNKKGENFKVSKSRLMEGIKIFDAATVMSIWKAVTLETKDLHPKLNPESEEFLTHVAMRTEHIVNMTQPSFDLMNRTNLSSYSHPIARTITMFGSARSKLGALMIDGLMDYVANPTKENKLKLFSRSVNVLMLTALAMGTINALKGLDFPDDWEDKKSGDLEFGRMAKWSTIEMANNMASSFFGLSEISRSILSRFDDAPWTADLEHPVEGLFNEAMGGVSDVFKFRTTDDRTGKSQWKVDDGMWKLTKTGFKYVGLPSKVTSTFENLYETVVDDE